MSTIAAMIEVDDQQAWSSMVRRLEQSSVNMRSWSPNAKVSFAVGLDSTPVFISSDGTAILLGYITDYDLILATGLTDISNLADAALLAIRKHGNQVFSRLSGGFVFIYWDEETSRLHVIRDRIGLQPLYYVQHTTGWLLASRTKFLLAAEQVMARPDRETIQHYQYSGWAPRGRSFLAGVRNCAAGTVTALNGRGEKNELLNPIVPTHQFSCMSDLVSTIRSSAKQVVCRHVPAHGRLGVAVSGGIDSVYMTALVKDAIGSRDLIAFSYGYGADDPNVMGGKQISETLGIEHRAIYTEAFEVPDLLAQSIYHLEEPVGRDQYVMLYKMAHEASGQVDYLFTGNCVDYDFGNPPLALNFLKANRWPFLRSMYEDIASEDYSGRMPKSLLGKAVLSLMKIRGISTPPAAKVIGAFPRNPDINFPRECQPLLETTKHKLQFAAGEQGIKALMLEGAHIAMRQPYADVAMLGLSLSYPDNWRFQGNQLKIPMRMAAESMVPKNLAWAPKGIAQLKHNDELWDTIINLIKTISPQEVIAARGVLDQESVNSLLSFPVRRKRTMRWLYRLWYIAALELWFQTFIDNRGRRSE